MRYDPTRHQRRSIRLSGHDYAAPYAYFVTICVQGRRCLFGAVDSDTILLSDAGAIVRSAWEALPQRFPTIALDAYVVMPNHLHGIVTLGETPIAGVRLGDIVGAFKSLTTNAYSFGVRERGWVPFDQRLWQRNYYEHIIRDEADLARIRDYIEANPALWDADRLHPAAAPNRFTQE